MQMRLCQMLILSCQIRRIFLKVERTQIWIGQKALLPMASSPPFRPAIAALTTGKKKSTTMKENIINLTTTILPLRNSINRSPLRRGLLLTPLVLVCLALSPTQNAFGVSPAPDGGYAGNNTAEGTDALFSLTTGINNSGFGFQALSQNTSGNSNTAEGFRALWSNTSGGYNTANGDSALFSNTTGFDNTANGSQALASNTTGLNNTANGYQAL